MNLLYLHTHDMGRFNAIYGYAIPTPNMLRAAQACAVFRNAHCACPTCSPSRAAPGLCAAAARAAPGAVPRPQGDGDGALRHPARGGGRDDARLWPGPRAGRAQRRGARAGSGALPLRPHGGQRALLPLGGIFRVAPGLREAQRHQPGLCAGAALPPGHGRDPRGHGRCWTRCGIRACGRTPSCC